MIKENVLNYHSILTKIKIYTRYITFNCNFFRMKSIITKIEKKKKAMDFGTEG